MTDRHSNIDGLRLLVVGASSGIGQALAVAAQARGAKVALAARRIELLEKLAADLDGTAHELDVADPRAVASLNEKLGADRPPVEIYLSWVGGLLRGDMGQSYAYRSPVGPFVDDSGGPHATATQGTGHGLLGMQERVHAAGGTVEVGPRSGGGWRVDVRLPVEERS